MEIQFAEEVIERLLDCIEESVGIRLAWITLTPDGSMLSDLPAYEGAFERLSELLGFEIRGNEFLYDLAARLSSAPTT